MANLHGIAQVTYLVWDLDGVRQYFAEHFDLHPVASEASSLELTVGPTVLRFIRPAHPATKEYDLLRRAGGPVVSQVALAVDGLDEAVATLRANGVIFLQDDPVTCLDGRRAIDLDPSSTCGSNADAPFFGSLGSGADATVGVSLRLCASAPANEGVADAG